MGSSAAPHHDACLDEATSIGRFAAQVAEFHGVDASTYAQLHEWSVTEPELFWARVWDFFSVVSSAPYRQVVDRHSMPGARWFAGARLNYVDQVARHRELPGAAVVSLAEDGTRRELSWPGLLDSVAVFADLLRTLGIRPGDRVAGYLPNAQEAIVAFLGSAAVGATWACCAPDYGAQAAAERLSQLSPRVLVASTGYEFGGRSHDRREAVSELATLIGVEALIVVDSRPTIADAPATDIRVERWAEVVDDRAAVGGICLRTEQVSAEHPLWVLFSSGTTGRPKGIVHGHAGIIVTHVELFGLQMDLGPGDAFFWYTTTNWMLWNIVVGALLSGVTAVAYEGSPVQPTADRLWQIVADERVRVFGTSPGHLQVCAARGLQPGLAHDFSSLRMLAVTGAPMSPNLAQWVSDAVSPDIPVVSSSGGTDVASSFVGGAPSLSAEAGRIPGPILGVAVAAFDENGEAVRDSVAELVITQPMPSMPLGLWGDADGRRYREAYFQRYDGVWRHGDWVTHASDGSFEIHGRSDSTLNRNGVRIGSADLYTVVESHRAIAEALVVGVERPGGGYRMPMFLVASPGYEIDQATIDELRQRLRAEASPRHVPDEFHIVDALPHTKTGKKLEVPIKRILQGALADDVCSPGSIDRPELIDFYTTLARQWDAE
ncbi:acetoacetate--CoA ligase [Microbacterium terregens]|uniref:Acetoacetate--CoA ligase n=1 Tax=Microbacterium terregens TaxID=69363 RepID=A0ABV5SWK7_9MICO